MAEAATARSILPGFYDLTGYDLHTHPEPWQPERIVACVNVWNDRHSLERTLPTWAGKVDQIIAVDGAYAGMDGGLSDDGTRELLQSHGAAIVDAAGLPQHDKRTHYFSYAREGDLLLIVDADESFTDLSGLDALPYFDVGWIRYTAPIYMRPQWIPRLIRWQPDLNYQKRHHWLYQDDAAVCTNQLAGPGHVHRRIEGVAFHNDRGRNRPTPRQNAANAHRHEQAQAEQDASPELRVWGHEPLRILHLSPFDPGAVCFRLHAALNCSPHTSVLATGTEEWTEVPRQFDYMDDLVPTLALEADVLHHHVNYGGPVKRETWTVIHHHGTEYRIQPERFNEMDAERADLRLVSNFELLQYGDNLNWLPNPIPVAEYRKLALTRPAWQKDTLIVAHSPTKPEKKGSDILHTAVQKCRAKGLDVRLNMIYKLPIRHALEVKARCHAMFDSFWLGIQCSGLEAAAMGLPVIAGDPDCRAGYMEYVGHVPYTYANDETALIEQLERLATDEAYYHEEAGRVSAYCAEYHDQATVVARYLDLLDGAVNWRDTLTMGTP